MVLKRNRGPISIVGFAKKGFRPVFARSAGIVTPAGGMELVHTRLNFGAFSMFKHVRGSLLTAVLALLIPVLAAAGFTVIDPAPAGATATPVQQGGVCVNCYTSGGGGNRGDDQW